MSMRVATFAQSASLLQSALRIQAKEAEITQQEASGQISADYGGLGSTSKSVISLETSVSRSKAYASAAETAGARVEQMYDTVGSMIDLLTSFQSDVISLDSTLADSGDTLATSAESVLSSLASLLNTHYAGSYLFSGSALDTAPVDLSALADQTVPSSEDTSYYQGDDALTSVRVGAETTVTYGVTADNPAFEAAIRAAALIASGASDDATRAEVEDLLETAVDGLTEIQTRLSLNASRLETAVATEEDYQDFAATQISSLSEVDVAEAAARLSTYQTQLEAAYAAIGKIQSLSLADYLK